MVPDSPEYGCRADGGGGGVGLSELFNQTVGRGAIALGYPSMERGRVRIGLAPGLLEDIRPQATLVINHFEGISSLLIGITLKLKSVIWWHFLDQETVTIDSNGHLFLTFPNLDKIWFY